MLREYNHPTVLIINVNLDIMVIKRRCKIFWFFLPGFYTKCGGNFVFGWMWKHTWLWLCSWFKYITHSRVVKHFWSFCTITDLLLYSSHHICLFAVFTVIWYCPLYSIIRKLTIQYTIHTTVYGRGDIFCNELKSRLLYLMNIYCVFIHFDASVKQMADFLVFVYNFQM